MFHTSVKYLQKYTQQQRDRIDYEDKLKEVEVDSYSLARKRMRDKERVSLDTPLILEAQEPLKLVINGEERVFVDAAASHEVERVTVSAEDVSLMKYAIRMREDMAWPFKGKNARAGFKPVFPEGVWEHVFDYGMYCMRCFNRHASEWPDTCNTCGLTSEERNNAIDHLNRCKQIFDEKASSAANKLFAKSLGIVLPSGVKT